MLFHHSPSSPKIDASHRQWPVPASRQAGALHLDSSPATNISTTPPCPPTSSIHCCTLSPPSPSSKLFRQPTTNQRTGTFYLKPFLAFHLPSALSALVSLLQRRSWNNGTEKSVHGNGQEPFKMIVLEEKASRHHHRQRRPETPITAVFLHA